MFLIYNRQAKGIIANSSDSSGGFRNHRGPGPLANIINTPGNEGYRSIIQNKEYSKEVAENIYPGKQEFIGGDIVRKRPQSGVFNNVQFDNILKLDPKRSALSVEEMLKLKRSDSIKRKC